MSFIHEDFMLQNDTAKHLYHDYAKSLPIFDYHCHLDPKLIAKDHEFENITELWLARDHYKWRAMRANGVPEEKITGNATPEEKFKVWAQTVESCVGNPLYHWTHLELKRYFGVDDLLSGDNWKEIYDKANKVIKEKKLTARQLIEDSNVAFVGTTDYPTDSLIFHDEIVKDESFSVKVAPAFRPDEAFKIGEERFLNFIEKLQEISQKSISTYKEMLEQLKVRIDYFDQRGAMISDHGLGKLVYAKATEEEIEVIFKKALEKRELNQEEKDQYITHLLVDLGKIYYEKNWVMQIHFGAIRNNNSLMYEAIGVDAGFDSIDDQSGVAYALNELLDALAKEEKLPKTIIYNLNPAYNHVVASSIANFQNNKEGIKGKIQFGSGWWFNDTEQGMLRQMATLADHGLLMHFVGMLTDSRSFVSYPRHEYFRRILCNYIGEQVEQGKFPKDEKLLRKLVENICYHNAAAYFSKNQNK
ncbi:D-glucuronate isomerase [Garciella nitratireducens DSM 15102]|uniref:Uronate isomerase n=2 Tax=Garciella TaxID=218204 RepID=A0A1T4P3L6_9FIRM|nr:D-glucuronate isomerase [Garciella nitratireducens DSM 15102]